MMLSNRLSIANGIWGVCVRVGVSDMDGVGVIVGVSVILGVVVIDGVSVIVGVRVIVGVGGKKLYATGSANLYNMNVQTTRMNAKNSKRQPRTMRSLRIRKNRMVFALRIDRIPLQILNIMPKIAKIMAV
jgi:hypothetical protein